MSEELNEMFSHMHEFGSWWAARAVEIKEVLTENARLRQEVERLRGELADVRCQFSIMDSLRKTEKSRAEKAEAALAESLARTKAMERIVQEARYEMATHGEHCDCETCAAFFDLDYPEKPTLSQTAKAGESK